MHIHRNNIGLIRLILASLVIVGHAPEIIDGDRHREPLTLVFHTLSFGELAVDGFFLISGLLITRSMVRTQSLAPYLINRAARIYPAFLAAYFACVIASEFVGGRPLRSLGLTLLNAITLRPPPPFPGQLAGLHYPVLNGAMWTISYEFRCYFLVAALWAVGLLRQRFAVLVLTFAFLALATLSHISLIPSSFDRWISRGDWVLGSPPEMVRLTAIFLVGASASLFQGALLPRISAPVAALALVCMIPCLFFKEIAETSVALFGGVVLLWLSFNARLGPFQRINDRYDISYGTYLYGWPVAALLLYFFHINSPITLACVSLVIALVLGCASWFFLEKWTKDPWKHRPLLTATT